MEYLEIYCMYKDNKDKILRICWKKFVFMLYKNCLMQ